MKNKNPPKPHDLFAKEVLSNKENAMDFFQGILPENIGTHINLATLKQESTSYTDETLSEYFSDLVFTCRSRGKPMKLILLFEHKSFVPSFPFYQLLRYFSNIWYQQMKGGKPLSVILPLILYHGKKRWKKKPLSRYLSGNIDKFKRFIPEFDYLLVDLSKFSEEEIKSALFQRTAVRLWLLVQKYIFNPMQLQNNLRLFQNTIFQSPNRGSIFLIHYSIIN